MTSTASETPDGTLTVLVYSDDPAVREQVRVALGRRPVRELGRVEYVEIDDGGAVVEAVDAGGIDLCILDGEAWPTGGMGICRQLKNEIVRCPPILVLIARRDDGWLATWSQADGVLAHPLDAVRAREVVASVLRSGEVTMSREPKGGGPAPLIGHG